MYLISSQSFSTDPSRDTSIYAGVITQWRWLSDIVILVLMTIPPLQGGEKDMWAAWRECGLFILSGGLTFLW